MKNLTIRLADPPDFHNLANLSTQLGYPTTVEQAQKRLESILNRQDHAVFIAATRENQVLGWIHVYITYLIETEPFVEVGGLVVDQEHRAQGIGKALIREAETWTIHQGLHTVRVRSNTKRQEAPHFYPAIGYHKIKTQNVFIKELP